MRRSAENAQDAAEALRLTAQDLLKLGVVDEVVPEPVGGAHRGREATVDAVGEALDRALSRLLPLDGAAIVAQRRQKFLEMGKKGL